MQELCVFTLACIALAANVGAQDGFFRHLAWGDEPRTFQYHTHVDMVSRVQSLAENHPNILEFFSVQDRYSLPAEGSCDGQPCKQWVAVVGNRRSRKTDTPQVFLSGALHGNEVIGPAAVLETVTMMVEMYGRDAWVTQLVDTRTVVAMFAANADGYSGHKREDDKRDPNRDFAFDTKPSQCMTTMTAKAVNEVWRDHIFQLGVTFHGGDNLIGYAWGDSTHCDGNQKYSCNGGWEAPDRAGMHELGQRLVELSGPFGGSGLYKLGEMNKVIYAVNGGMEDWAYGGSWHKARVTCKAKGYPEAKTIYEDATLRSVLYLVETAMSKEPAPKTLGTTASVLQPSGPGDGHVPRNMRLALGLVEAVLPLLLLREATWDQQGDKLELRVRWVVSGAAVVDAVDVECDGAGISAQCVYEGAAGAAHWGAVELSGKVVVKPGPMPTRVRLRVHLDGHWSKKPSAVGPPESHWIRGRANSSYNAQARSGEVEVNGLAVVSKWVSLPAAKNVSWESSQQRNGIKQRQSRLEQRQKAAENEDGWAQGLVWLQLVLVVLAGIWASGKARAACTSSKERNV